MDREPCDPVGADRLPIGKLEHGLDVVGPLVAEVGNRVDLPPEVEIMGEPEPLEARQFARSVEVPQENRLIRYDGPVALMDACQRQPVALALRRGHRFPCVLVETRGHGHQVDAREAKVFDALVERPLHEIKDGLVDRPSVFCMAFTAFRT